MKIKDLHFYRDDRKSIDGDEMFFTYYAGFRITVLNRMTGFGYRDTETGLKDYRLNPKNDFWLASESFDIRNFSELDVEDAIQKIKENANTVVPKNNRKE